MYIIHVQNLDGSLPKIKGPGLILHNVRAMQGISYTIDLH